MTVWLTQWLCPARHCALAAAWDDAATTAAVIEATPLPAELNPWCGICGGVLRAESGRTAFASIAEARPAFDAVEAAQVETRAVLDRLGLSYDTQRGQGPLPE